MKKITKQKAQKYVGWARERMNWAREQYVGAKRFNWSATYDTKSDLLGGKSAREIDIESALETIKEAKERIAKYERYAI